MPDPQIVSRVFRERRGQKLREQRKPERERVRERA